MARTAELASAVTGTKCCCDVRTEGDDAKPVDGPMPFKDPRNGGTETGFPGVVSCQCEETVPGIDLGGIWNAIINPVYRAKIGACSCPTISEDKSEGGGGVAVPCSGGGFCALTNDTEPVSGSNLNVLYNNGTCVCATGFKPPDCAEYDNDNCPLPWHTAPGVVIEACSGNGKCSPSETDNHCLCNPGWTGVACDRPMCVDPSKVGKTPNLQACNGNGTCFYGVCDCESGFTGRFCERHDDAPGGASGDNDNGGPSNGSGARGAKAQPRTKQVKGTVVYAALGGIVLLLAVIGLSVWIAHRKRTKARAAAHPRVRKRQPRSSR